MGVRGLSSFIRSDPRNFRSLRLHNTYVVLDGFNVINFLYINSSLYTQFNGEYLAFDILVENLVVNMRKCRIEPIFVFDGIHECSKLETLLRRNHDRLVTCAQFQKMASVVQDGCDPCLRCSIQPPLTSVSFVRTLDRIKARHVTADREADQLVVAIAIQLHCPVISNDSDFFILGPYLEKNDGFSFVPLDFCNFEPIQFESSICNVCLAKKGNITCLQNCFYFESQCFFPEGNLFKNLLPIQRPLFAALCGNDFIPPGYFNRSLPGSSEQQQHARPTAQAASKIAVSNRNANKFRCVIDWLSGFGSNISNPVDRILSRFPMSERSTAANYLFAGLKCYVIDTVISSPMLCEFLKSLSMETEPQKMHNLYENRDNSVNPIRFDSFTFVIPPSSSIPIQDDAAKQSEKRTFGEIASEILSSNLQQSDDCIFLHWPASLINSFRCRKIMPALCDAIYSRGCVLGPVLEDIQNREAFHYCAIPIRRLFYGVILHLERDSMNMRSLPGIHGPLQRPFTTEYTRVGTSHIKNRHVDITYLNPKAFNLQVDAGFKFLSINLGLPPKITHISSWLHGIACLYILWLKSDKQCSSSLSTSSIGLSLSLCSFATYTLISSLPKTSHTNFIIDFHKSISSHLTSVAALKNVPKPPTSSKSSTNCLRFQFLHAMVQTQCIHYTLQSLIFLLDAVCAYDASSTCLTLPPPYIFFPSGFLAHQLAIHLAWLSPEKRLENVATTLLPMLLGKGMQLDGFEKPSDSFIEKAVNDYNGLVKFIDNVFAESKANPLAHKQSQSCGVKRKPSTNETLSAQRKNHLIPTQTSNPKASEIEARVVQSMLDNDLTYYEQIY